MRRFVIYLDLLTDRYVAADPTDRESAEWPPHPGRVFMALAATCFELGSDPQHVAAIRWLEKLGPPIVRCGRPEFRSKVGVYVPVNDKVTDEGGPLQTAPGMIRSRQERFFPTIVPDNEVVRLEWNLDEGVEVPLAVLDQICGETIRVGHSSSLVRGAAMLESEAADDGFDGMTWSPAMDDDHFNTTEQVSLRVACEGETDRLIVDGKREAVDRFADLSDQIDDARGKAKTQLKDTFQAEFGVKYSANLRPPEPTPARIRHWQTYTPGDGVGDLANRQAISDSRDFHADAAVLAIIDGPRLGLEDTLMLTGQLRRAVLARCGVQPAPTWISGHDETGAATRDPHIAIVPLPYVDTKYADGHVMGLAILHPKSASPSEIGRCLGPLLYDDDGQATNLTLNYQRFDPVHVQLEQRSEPAKTLRANRWLRPSRNWASVTPVVLDRFPKVDRRKDPRGWRDEVGDILYRSCEFAGLPQPTTIDFETTSFIRGVPRATPKRASSRLAKTEAGEQVPAARSAGTGFPPFSLGGKTNAGKPSRPQIHVRLTFDSPHRGPVLLGAGRFLGYGFFQPIGEPGRRR